MSKLYWVSLILGVLGILQILSPNELKIFGLLMIGIAILIAWLTNRYEVKKESEAAVERAAFAAQGFPVYWDLPLGHFYGAYDQWQAGSSDSAGGWDVLGAVQNVTQKTINYLDLYVFPTDRFGKRLARTECWSYTGPFPPAESKVITSKHNWYDQPVNEVAVERIVVEYADQSTQFTTNSMAITLSLGNEDSGKWFSNRCSADGSWVLRGTFLYKDSRPAQQINLYAIPYDRQGNKLSTPLKIFGKTDYKKDHSVTFRWKGLWKNLPVHTVKLEKAEIILSSGDTLQVPIQ